MTDKMSVRFKGEKIQYSLSTGYLPCFPLGRIYEENRLNYFWVDECAKERTPVR